MSAVSDPYQIWGERTSLLPKKLAYVFSLDLCFRVEPGRAYWIGNELACRLEIDPRGEPPAPPTYHVLDSSLVELPNGSIHDVPCTRATSGIDWLRLRNNGTASLQGRVVLDADEASLAGRAAIDPRRLQKRMALSYGGVANLTHPGALFIDDDKAIKGHDKSTDDRAERLGTAFIALKFESSHPLYRWLVISQYAGFGEIHLDPGLHVDGEIRYRRLRFSYDVHAAG
jgi:hypothetical protein